MVMVATGNTISMAGTAVVGSFNASVEKELGGTGTTQISLNDTTVRTLAKKTTSGSTIALSDFYGKAYYLITTGAFSIKNVYYYGYGSPTTGSSITNTLSTIYPGKTINSLVYYTGAGSAFNFGILEVVTNTGWTNLTMANSTASFTVARTAAAFSNTGGTTFGNTYWSWAGANSLIQGIMSTPGNNAVVATWT